MRVLESTLLAAKVNDEFICTRACFTRIKSRLKAFQERHSHVFRYRREQEMVVIWRSR